MIYILTGNIRTGKTTALLDWSGNRNDVDGLLCPDDVNGKRYFLKIKSQASFPLEVSTSSDNVTISIGKFKFLKSSFEIANDYLISSGKKKKVTYFIIDELGKLELRNEGLHKAAVNLISEFESDEQRHLIIIIRESLISEILQHYNISKYQLVKKENLFKLN